MVGANTVRFDDYEFIRKIQSGELDVITWLSGQDEESIRERINERIDDDLDVSEGSYLYDATEPSNVEFAIAYFMLKNIILLAFPQHSFDEWLDMAAAMRGVYRNKARYATGKLVVKGSAGTVIPAGTRFSNTIPFGSTIEPKYYSTMEEAVIDESGKVEIPIQADEPGAKGNAKVGEINLNIQDVKDIESVTNEKPIQNGVDQEKDVNLLERVLEAARNTSTSGNKKSYRKWAKEVSGVADAEVIPLWKGPGTVKVIIVGDGGKPIPELISDVKEYLDPSDHEGEGEGCAPIGAVVTVSTVENLIINVSIASIEVSAGYETEQAKINIKAAIAASIAKVGIGGMVRIREVEDSIKHAEGIVDFGKVLINGSDENIQASAYLKPIVGEVTYNGNS